MANGIALGNLMERNNKVTLVFTGEGGTSEGDFHEALNVASVWSLPVIFLIENNGYGLSTPTAEQYNCHDLSDRGVGYGIDAHTVDGNNIIEVFTKIRDVSNSIRKNPHPVLIECKTFRMRGHEEASGLKYVPEKLLQEWALKDPISNFEKYLIKNKIIDNEQIVSIRKDVQFEIDEGIKFAFSEDDIIADKKLEIESVFKQHHSAIIKPTQSTNKIRFIDAISSGLEEAMKKHEKSILMGQDIAEYGGVFNEKRPIE